jgi:single-strand DNA-binding protein
LNMRSTGVKELRKNSAMLTENSKGLSEEVVAVNQVHLVGRVSGQASEKTLPSGELLVEFRLVVERENQRSERREVDTLDIAVWSTRLRKRALSFLVDEWVEVDGALRRRFWQSPSGLASRWQVEASQVRRL